MVRLMDSRKAAAAALAAPAAAVKLEVDDPLEEAYAPLHKRPKSSIQVSIEPKNMGKDDNYLSHYSPLDEPSPLGLRLRKSPSLLELIQMRLAETNCPEAGGHDKKEHKGAAGATEKLKASNFPASVLRIGTWEYKSRYEGDLVGKCYFAKHKLVWEVLDGGLKNKIEIQWSDIMALKANYPDDACGSLDVALARQPLFYRETNPQPRKHTLWQATSDFTDGQATVCRHHYIQCPQGLLGRHFEKLIQCDPRLCFLSQQPEITLESPYFEPRISAVDEPSEANNSFEIKTEESCAPFLMRDVTSACAQSSSSKNDHDFFGRLPVSVPREILSPSSGMDTCTTEEIKSIGPKQWEDKSSLDDIRVSGLHTSMSMSDMVCHLEKHISEQRKSNNSTLSTETRQSLEILEDISRCLFSDTHNMPDSDEKSLMSRVNSLCCLLQKDPSLDQNTPSRNDDCIDVSISGRSDKSDFTPSGESRVEENSSTSEYEDLSDCKQTSSMSRKDSVGDLLVNLPRVASLPQFFYTIGDDYDNQAR